MEVGESSDALPREGDDRKAFCELSEALKGENCMMSDVGFEGFPQVRLVRQACGFGMGAFVGNGENLFVGCGFQDGLHTHISDIRASRSSRNVGDCPALSLTASNISRQLAFQVDNDEISDRFEDVHEAGGRDNGPRAPGNEDSDFASPRISFSRDFAMVDIGIGGPTNTLNNNTQSSSPRLSPEKRKWEQQDCYSSDFQFSSNKPISKGISPTKGGSMISADELFCNGKLLPLPYPSRQMSYDDLCLPLTSAEHYGGQQAAKVPLCKTDGSRPLARHLSFELARPDFAVCCTAPNLHASLQPPPDTCTTVPIASLSHSLSSSPSFKYSLRFKEMFKLKKGSTDSSPDSELGRDSSVTSTCRLPISPRSFWPFLRNGAPLVCLNVLDRAASTSSKGSDDNEVASNTNRLGHVTVPEMEVPHTEGIIRSHSQVMDKLAFSSSSMYDIRESITPPLRDYRSPSEVFKHRASATRSFARGSPARRGDNANKVLLKNLERCSAEKKLGYRDGGQKGVNKRGPYTAAACRVSPVLNVVLYKGGSTSKKGFFGFSNLFSSRKSKKSMEAAINWRKGAGVGLSI